jgi:hypothetical protein
VSSIDSDIVSTLGLALPSQASDIRRRFVMDQVYSGRQAFAKGKVLTMQKEPSPTSLLVMTIV